ncbi:hypothetical protein BDV97DRAFT_352179 [Delphinella strobiligena]|nr:hypothetical protein BDV97DRAFT_352179 [Delphinella strobiligena]
MTDYHVFCLTSELGSVTDHGVVLNAAKMPWLPRVRLVIMSATSLRLRGLSRTWNSR